MYAIRALLGGIGVALLIVCLLLFASRLLAQDIYVPPQTVVPEYYQSSESIFFSQSEGERLREYVRQSGVTDEDAVLLQAELLNAIRMDWLAVCMTTIRKDATEKYIHSDFSKYADIWLMAPKVCLQRWWDEHEITAHTDN